MFLEWRCCCVRHQYKTQSKRNLFFPLFVCINQSEMRVLRRPPGFFEFIINECREDTFEIIIEINVIFHEKLSAFKKQFCGVGGHGNL